MSDDDRYRDPRVNPVEARLRSDLTLLVYLVLHFVWLWVASWAFLLGESWDRFLSDEPQPAIIGWTFATLTFLMLSFLWNRRIYGGWRFGQ